ncbi:hypothetical protein KIN20_032939 [Parelaphostrongylus tenuis]|uniref:Uncharacterized protein n=1 Tax=Parelaphostrongylus tenuis TaxID=148309 RepID=A0AAD5R786_PARTN|nr:hypothetical protein KIN20_032939 [Parelaphostrongylus tenuis]
MRRIRNSFLGIVEIVEQTHPLQCASKRRHLETTEPYVFTNSPARILNDVPHFFTANSSQACLKTVLSAPTPCSKYQGFLLQYGPCGIIRWAKIQQQICELASFALYKLENSLAKILNDDPYTSTVTSSQARVKTV